MTEAPSQRDLYRILQVDPRACPSVIHAAYRALARIVHPDQVTGDAAAMVKVNTAYAVLRDPKRRATYDDERAAPPRVASTEWTRGAPMVPPPPLRAQEARLDATVLGHGRYSGWTLEQLVRHDPDYLRWMRRHTSGVRHRAEIDRLLERVAATPSKRR